MSSSKFITSYGPKKTGANEFFPEMDITDQRAPVMTPQDALEQFFHPDPEVMEELESEDISDFDADIYDYEDRGEYGEDVALAQQPEITKHAPRPKKTQEKR